MVTKLVFIHPTANFYATSVQKPFYVSWFYASNWPSRVMIKISNFGEDKIVSMFYACGLHILCIVPMLIIHPYSGKHDVVEAITVVLGEMSISPRDFYAVTKLIFYSFNY